MKYGYNSGGGWQVSKDRKPTKEYSRWATMMSRCYNPKCLAYPDYGGRGVSVCTDWHDFQKFAQWYSENNTEGWVMDKDLHGGLVYSPETVVFVPDQINQILKCYEKPLHGVGKATHTWYAKTVDVDGKQHIKGKFNSPDDAAEYYQWYLREKMKKLVDKYSIPAATAARLLSL
ncbi:hypothetical protein vB_PsyM_KIL4_0001 [Pseudomonas phage vB_PsyM_KIL4]|uniref:Uncharacterized protein n=2 Tax=Flaumdravirus TaxID=2560133 RepID=A0A142IES9_9CAUD|nr:HNH endonuclease [Pseudomonas phage vB_PsyM_KIL4]AMR57734.1 hypothetical protein vB_PsyM_KIL4_0001 [Pseudomonas phage vB_PsyM_KIL4]AMR57901.1 hypothetical protein vB_PsyM_KIL5_0001 [Pseudomonas phage vB_PsyM_KIL5]